MSELEERAREHFEEATAEHEMTIMHTHGLYRHLRFRSPKTWSFGYDLITWPGCLAMEGDIPSGLIFARLPDMIDFFASGPGINPDYWAEKITNEDARRATKVYSRDILERQVGEHFRELRDLGYSVEQEAVIRKEWAEYIDFRDIDHEYPAKEALMDFKEETTGFTFGDAWEWSLREWDSVFLMCCFAIRAGVERYREAK